MAGQPDQDAQQPIDQPTHWNGPGGRAWVELQPVLDALFKPFEDHLIEAINASGATRILDIGCGAGAATLAAAREEGVARDCLGLDISETLLEKARGRASAEASTARFLAADAATHVFEPAAFDLLVSRFGVMFFSDPAAAFANMRRAIRPGGGLYVQAWRGPEDNPFMTAGPRAARRFLDLPAFDPDAPGQFAFADAAKVRRILEASGWSEIEITPLDVECALPESELVRFFTLLGPVGAALQREPEARRPEIVEHVRRAFDPFVEGGEVRFTAGCWRIEAKNPG